MTKQAFSLLLAIAACETITAQSIHFHSDFDEADLEAITGLNIDTPNTDLGTTDSGTVTLDTENQTLNFASNGANLWTAREGAPIAWVASPEVTMGSTWFAETQIIHTDSPGAGAQAEWDQAGLTFFSGTPGANPGSENIGVFQSLILGINDWNAWAHRIQGFADNDPNISEPATEGDDSFYYRVEVTENGPSDLYNFFYKEESEDPWIQFGPVDLAQDFDNSAVGLVMKSHNTNTTSTTRFEYFSIGTVPNLSGDLIAYTLASPPQLHRVGEEIHLLVYRNDAAADLELSTESSPDLTDWTETGSLISDVDQGNGTSLQTYLMSEAASSFPSLFARVIVRAPEN